MIVNMPVEALSENCINCPELEIDIITTELYAMDMPKEGYTTIVDKKFDNKLRCTHCNRCALIADSVITKTATEKASSKTSKRTTKSTTAKKKTVKDK